MEIATLIVLAQLIDAYIRFLAFSGKVFDEVRLRLFASSAIWGAVSFALYVFIFDEYGINATTYKAILMLGWLPYFCICKHFIPWGLPQHVFVLGMEGLWAFMLHASEGAIVKLIYGAMTEEFLPLQLTIYLILFAALLGHGLGMSSLAAFAKKYDAYVDLNIRTGASGCRFIGMISYFLAK